MTRNLDLSADFDTRTRDGCNEVVAGAQLDYSSGEDARLHGAPADPMHIRAYVIQLPVHRG